MALVQADGEPGLDHFKNEGRKAGKAVGEGKVRGGVVWMSPSDEKSCRVVKRHGRRAA